MRHDWYVKNRESQIAAATAYQAAHPEKAREYNRKAQETGREKFKAQKREYYRANRSQIRAAATIRYKEDHGFRVARLAASRRRYVEKPGEVKASVRKWQIANEQRTRELKARWVKVNPEVARLAAILGQQRRRARVRGLPHKIDAAAWKRSLHYYAYACAYCFRTDVPLSIDHILPISRAGTNAEANLAPACLRCNSSKSDRTPLECLAGLRLGG